MFRPTVIGQDGLNLVQTAMKTTSTSAAGAAHDSPSSPRRPAHPGTLQEAEFVGREPELAVLDAQLTQVSTHGARVVRRGREAGGGVGGCGAADTGAIKR